MQMRNKLWTLALAAALAAGTSGMALAQTYNTYAPNTYPPPPNPAYSAGNVVVGVANGVGEAAGSALYGAGRIVGGVVNGAGHIVGGFFNGFDNGARGYSNYYGGYGYGYGGYGATGTAPGSSYGR